MNDKNGIEIKCKNCNYANDSRICYDHKESGDCVNLKAFFASRKALEARIAELQAQQFTREEMHFIKCNLDLNNPNKDGAYDMWTNIRAKCAAILSEKGVE